ncbi:carbohydrate porin [Acetobacter musti]|uniref:Carbohydrate porin n=1 Tax=Acetobacter musti TaxID=864732 RepID=A0ABX0JPW7_9PROT|nr:carbohydrate porin [Acetobacter musti]NHN84531.1 carbohydrate porin [Acetobacter musti]
MRSDDNEIFSGCLKKQGFFTRKISVFIAVVFLFYCHDGYFIAVARAALISTPYRPVPAENNDAAGDTDSRLTGNWYGLRDRLLRYGVDVRISDTNELWSVPVGGERASNNYIGSTTVEMETDLRALTGLKLGHFDVSAIEIRGRPFSNVPLYVFNQTSNIEADDNTRLYEMWYDQSFLSGTLSVRVGKIDLGRFFMLSDVALNFLNASFAWPILPDNDLYDQGPVSPVTTPAICLRYTLSPAWNFLLAAGDDNPIGRPFVNVRDPWNQNSDPGGTRFSFSSGALIFGEVQYRRHSASWDGTYKIGGYFDTGRFPDQSDMRRMHRTNWSVYAVADQTFTRLNGGSEIAGFVRGNWTGDSDRNQIVYAFDAGLVLKAPWRRRDDVLGLGAGLGAASPFLARADRRAGLPRQGTEYHLELTYRYQCTAWLALQPDIQGVLSPSGGTVSSQGRHISDEAIFGLHSNVTF